MPRACAAAVLAPVLLLTLAAAAIDYRRVAPPPGHTCGAQGTYAPGSAYETNLRLLAAIVPDQANASSCKCSPGNNAGERPDRVIASAYCYWRPDGSSSDCGACIAQAFREAERLCRYHRQAMVVVDGGECSVSFHDEQRMEEGMGVGLTGHTPDWLENALEFADVLFTRNNFPDVLLVLLFQAAGLGCVVFVFILERRSRSRGPGSDGNDYLPVTGDQ